MESMQNRSQPDKWLVTIEMFRPAWEHAQRTLQNLPVTCLLGGTVGLEGYLKPQDMTAKDMASEHYRIYYERDMQLAMGAPALLQDLCEQHAFDLVLIDGNEYTGWAEFNVVNSTCRPRFLALHDTGTLKTRKVEQAIADAAGQAPQWKLVASGADAASWAVFQNEQW